MSQIYDYAILGAGLSGVLAASELSRLSSNLALFEKGRGVGGRLSRFEKYNLGPDFIPRHELTDKIFRDHNTSKPYFHYSPINTLLKTSLDQTPELKTFFSTKITSACFDSGLWTLRDQYHHTVQARWLISSLPQPQAYQLFSNQGLTFNKVDYTNAVTVVTVKPTEKMLDECFSVTKVDNKYKVILEDLCQSLFDSEKREDLFHERYGGGFEKLHFWRYAFCRCHEKMKDPVYPDLHLGFIGDWLSPGNNLWSAIQSTQDLISALKNSVEVKGL